MQTPLHDLIRHTRRLLAAALDEDVAVLAELLASRQRLLDALGAALAAGARPSGTETEEIRALEGELTQVLEQRRDAASAALVGLHRGRQAERTYAPPTQRAPIYFDRAG